MQKALLSAEGRVFLQIYFDNCERTEFKGVRDQNIQIY